MKDTMLAYCVFCTMVLLIARVPGIYRIRKKNKKMELALIRYSAFKGILRTMKKIGLDTGEPMVDQIHILRIESDILDTEEDKRPYSFYGKM